MDSKDVNISLTVEQRIEVDTTYYSCRPELLMKRLEVFLTQSVALPLLSLNLPSYKTHHGLIYLRYHRYTRTPFPKAVALPEKKISHFYFECIEVSHDLKHTCPNINSKTNHTFSLHTPTHQPHYTDPSPTTINHPFIPTYHHSSYAPRRIQISLISGAGAGNFPAR